MRKLLWLLGVMCCAASIALAGPNSGGVLLVHDTGLVYSTDTPGPPYGGPVPASAADVDIQSVYGTAAANRIWKVYAAFPSGSSPRLERVAWGIGFTESTPAGDGYVTVTRGAVSNTGDMEVAAVYGWPITSGAGCGIIFTGGTRTNLMPEIYWFAGYAYPGGSGYDVSYFCVQPHPIEESAFWDDSPIKIKDGIAGYGCLGFGGPGHTHIPVAQGSCCASDGGCTVTTQADCAGTWTANAVCGPNPCPQPGRCCLPNGACVLVIESLCGGTWVAGTSCSPNPCPQLTGSCCAPDGACTVTQAPACPGTWTMFGVCTPNPCLAGACCLHSEAGTCEIHTPTQCALYGGTYLGIGVLCAPSDTCLTTGAGGTFPDVSRLQVLTAPNPSRAGVVIRCLLPMREAAVVVLFDASGRIVRFLHQGVLPAGETPLSWDGRDDNGREVPAGVYLVRVTTSAGGTSGRVVLTR